MPFSASRHRHALLAFGLILAVLVVYWPSATGMWAFWMQPDGAYKYGLLVTALSIWLLLRSRNAFAAAPVKPNPWVIPALLLVSAGTMLFWRAGIETLQLALLPPLLLLAVFGALGAPIARIVAFPLGFLYFAGPGWGLLAPALQRLTFYGVSVIAALIKLPARFSGDVVTLPGGAVFEIGSKCSGVDFLLVGLAVSALIGELERGSLKRRAWLMVFMGGIAIVGNWIRVLLIIVIGYASHMHNALATSEHLFFGWIVFATLLLMFLWLVPRKTSLGSERGNEATSFAFVHTGHTGRGTALAAVAALVLFPGWVYAMALTQGPNGSAMKIVLPQAQAPWRGPFAANDPIWLPQFVGAHTERQFTYEGSDGHSVEVAAIGYVRQEQGRELLNAEHSLAGKAGSSAIAYGTATAGGQRFLELTAEDAAGHRSLIWSSYDIGGRRFATPLYSQLWYGLEALIRPPYSVLYAFRTSCQPSCAAARSELESFVECSGGRLSVATHDSREKSVGDHG